MTIKNVPEILASIEKSVPCEKSLTFKFATTTICLSLINIRLIVSKTCLDNSILGKSDFESITSLSIKALNRIYAFRVGIDAKNLKKVYLRYRNKIKHIIKLERE